MITDLAIFLAGTALGFVVCFVLTNMKILRP